MDIKELIERKREELEEFELHLSNLVEKAIERGFKCEIDEDTDIHDLRDKAEDWLFKNVKRDSFSHCELSCGRNQYYQFCDEQGFFFDMTGDIFDFNWRYKAADEILWKCDEDGNPSEPVDWFEIDDDNRSQYAFVFDKVINSDAQVIWLFDYFE